MQKKSQFMNNMKISCVIPLYNCQDYAIQCIESVINQSYQDIEIILVDDGSTDCTPSICDGFSKMDERVVVIHKENGGLSSARNAGVSIATGEYVSFIDGDDYLESNFFSTLLEEVQNQNVGLVSCGFHFVHDDQKTVYRKDWEISSREEYCADKYLEMMLRSQFSCVVWNKLYRTSLCKTISFRRDRLNEDYLYNYYYAKLLIEKEMIVVSVPEKLYNYRKNSGGLTNSRLQNLLIDQVVNINEIVRDAGDMPIRICSAACHERVRLYSRLIHFLSINGADISLMKTYYKEFRSFPLRQIISSCRQKERIVGMLLWFSPSFFMKVKRFFSVL